MDDKVITDHLNQYFERLAIVTDDTAKAQDYQYKKQSLKATSIGVTIMQIVIILQAIFIWSVPLAPYALTRITIALILVATLMGVQMLINRRSENAQHELEQAIFADEQLQLLDQQLSRDLQAGLATKPTLVIDNVATVQEFDGDMISLNGTDPVGYANYYVTTTDGKRIVLPKAQTSLKPNLSAYHHVHWSGRPNYPAAVNSASAELIYQQLGTRLAQGYKIPLDTLNHTDIKLYAGLNNLFDTDQQNTPAVYYIHASQLAAVVEWLHNTEYLPEGSFLEQHPDLLNASPADTYVID